MSEICSAFANNSVVHSDPEILGGTPVFAGTRVPVQTLVDYLDGGYSIAEFLDNFPSVRHEQVDTFLRVGGMTLPLSATNRGTT